MRRYWGTSPIGSRRTKPPINTPDAGVTGAGWSGGHGQASRRGAGWSGGHGQASRRGAERSEIAKSRGRADLATPDTTRRPLHPLRGTTPVTGRCTRYGARHPIRRGALPTDRVHTQSQEQTRNLRGDRRYAQDPGSTLSLMRFCAGGNATRTRPRKLAQFDEVLRRRERDTHQAPGARAPGASTVTPQTAATSQTGARAPGAAAQSQLSRRSTSRRRGRR